MGIFEDQGLAHPQGLPVYLEHSLAVFILDPEIVANSHHLLAHLVAVAPATRSPELPIVLAFVTPFFSSTSHRLTSPFCVLLYFS
jgi:hypothetical protein